MKPTLVIGATGNIGSQVVDQLRDARVPVRAMTRNSQAARFPEGVDVVRGDLSLPETLDGPLVGVGAVFLVWTAPLDTLPQALERIVRTSERIVLLSSPHKTAHPFFQQPNPLRTIHAAIERSIEASGIPWTFLRPGVFAANARSWWAPGIRSGKAIRWPFLAASTAPVDERDVAAVAVRALCDDGHAGAEYVLTGPDSLTQAEQLEAIGLALGRRLSLEEISPEEARRELLPLMPLRVIDMLLDAWRASLGQPAFVTSTVADLTGNPAGRFLDWATRRSADFRE